MTMTWLWTPDSLPCQNLWDPRDWRCRFWRNKMKRGVMLRYNCCDRFREFFLSPYAPLNPLNCYPRPSKDILGVYAEGNIAGLFRQILAKFLSGLIKYTNLNVSWITFTHAKASSNIKGMNCLVKCRIRVRVTFWFWKLYFQEYTKKEVTNVPMPKQYWRSARTLNLIDVIPIYYVQFVNVYELLLETYVG